MGHMKLIHRFVIVALLLAFSIPSVSARSFAVLEKEGQASWYGAYLLLTEGGGENLATLRKGLTVEVIHKGQRRVKVRLVEFPDAKRVIVHKRGWPGDGVREGWVSSKFLRFLPDETEEVTADGAGLMQGLNVVEHIEESVDDSNVSELNQDQQGETDDLASQGPHMGEIGSTPGDEPWREELENVYYVLPDAAGTDGAQWLNLAKHRSLSAYTKKRGWRKVTNNIDVFIRKDIAAVGRPKTRIVRVNSTEFAHVFKVLAEGYLPEPGWKQNELYEVEQMAPRPCNVVGFCIISHGSTDGPMFGSGARKRKQLKVYTWVKDFERGIEGLRNRMVEGARVSFFACNTGSCQYYRNHPSVAHFFAALHKERNVVVRGKLGIGSPNAPASAYALFGVDDDGAVTRLTPKKKEYAFYVPVEDFKKRDSPRRWVYDTFEVHVEDAAERQELLDYYKERGISAKESSSTITVKAKKIGKVTRGSKKDPLLKSMVQFMAENPKKKLQPSTSGSSTSGSSIRKSWKSYLQRALIFLRIVDKPPEPPEVVVPPEPQPMSAQELARRAMPTLEKFLDDSKLASIIEVVKRENGGTMDLDDFRIWFRIYFHEYRDKNDRVSIARRACLCRDEFVSTKVFSVKTGYAMIRSDWTEH